MICLKTQYFSLNRILLLAIGLWPYQQSKFTQCQFIFLFGILSTCIIFMVKKLLIKLQDICNELKDKNEIAIIEEYGYVAKRYTLALISKNLSSEKTSKEVYLPIIIVGANIIYLFLANSIGQDITDHNAYVFATVYKVQWYVTPIGIQKMLLFLLQKGTKDFIMNVGGFFFPSLECFAMVRKQSYNILY
ncbi:uncharacterized protein LOC112552482 [Pogonomyrmex barbatus]|uniref:Uncharacterized protein LOC112552482 n=1 Tax=Pogonomyrmex barbatus TaxID=144034 RepID=A0A8N1S6F6_9HYME|nr:uncharacterized protein LOC112552482 [Pogonomyrmex barbatus]